MEIIQTEKLTRMPHLNLFRVHYRDRVLRDKTWVFASRGDGCGPDCRPASHPDAVVVVPFHEAENRLVIIREFRVVLGGYQFGFPAGLLDPGEDVADAGRRELFEETGLSITRILHQSPAVFSSSGMTDESVCLLYAACEGVPSTENTEDSEDIQVLLVSRNEAAGLLSRPDIALDVKTWIILQTYAVHGVI